MKRYYIILVLLTLTVNFVLSQSKQHVNSVDIERMRWGSVATRMPSEWYASEDAKRVAENVLISQKEIGGWMKDQPYHHHFSDSIKTHYLQAKIEKGGTFDNNATITEMRFLAKVYAQFKDVRYKLAFEKGMDYIFISQYENGGWPQFFPVRDSIDEILTDNTVPYSMHITYNDNAMVNIMKFLKEIFTDDELFTSMKIDKLTKEKAEMAFKNGVECLLKTQIVVENQLTVWCAQHDAITLVPMNARSYELASFSGSESVGITLLLMDIDNPSDNIIAAVEGAIKWFENNKIRGVKIENITDKYGKFDRVLVKDKNASPLWARFYDLETIQPFFCSRDGIKRNSMAEISQERRTGYGWYTDAPKEVLTKYPTWKKKWCIQ